MKRNYSYTYLMPILGEQVYFDRDMLRYIKNTYLFNTKYVAGLYFFILCSFNYSDPGYAEMESRFISNDLYIESHDIGSDTLYCFNFPEEYSSEYQHFINGKYSLFSNDVKRIIISFWSGFFGNVPAFVTGTLLKIKQVLFKDKRLRLRLEQQLSTEGHTVTIDEKAELGERIDLEKEQFIFPETSDDKRITLENLKNIF